MKRNGFSLFELIIVILITGILLSIVLPYGKTIKENTLVTGYIKYSQNLVNTFCIDYINNDVTMTLDTNTSLVVSDYLNSNPSFKRSDYPNGLLNNYNSFSIPRLEYKNNFCEMKIHVPTNRLQQGLNVAKIDVNGSDTILTLRTILPDNGNFFWKNYHYNENKTIQGNFDNSNVMQNSTTITSYDFNGNPITRIINRPNTKNYNNIDYNDLPYSNNTIPLNKQYINY